MRSKFLQKPPEPSIGIAALLQEAADKLRALRNFPRWERNLNRGGLNLAHPSGVPALNTVHHSASHPSRLVLPTIARK